jgi:hypothetical protein
MSLELRYRRLLRAYPRSYREHRGEEIIATLMEDSTPGRSRPDRRAAVDLLLGGLRERLGLHNPDGLTAGAALAAPICLTLAAIDALSTMILGPGATIHMMVAYAWLVAVAVWATAPQLNTVVVTVALGVTGVAVVNGDAYASRSVLAWGLATFIGCLSVRAPSVHRGTAVRLGVPVLVAILSGLIWWWPVTPPVTDYGVYVGGTGVLSGVVTDVAAIGAVIVGVAFAGRRGRARVAWATFVVLGVWAVSGAPGAATWPCTAWWIGSSWFRESSRRWWARW